MYLLFSVCLAAYPKFSQPSALEIFGADLQEKMHASHAFFG